MIESIPFLGMLVLILVLVLACRKWRQERNAHHDLVVAIRDKLRGGSENHVSVIRICDRVIEEFVGR